MYAKVLVDAVIRGDDAIRDGDKVFDYAVPAGMGVQTGMRVLVPFGGRDIDGFVLALAGATDVAIDKIKPISKVLDDFVAVKPEFLEILPQICDMFKLRKIDVLRLFVPSPLRGRKRARVPKNKEIRAVDIQVKNVTLTEQQQSVADTIVASANVLRKKYAEPFLEQNMSNGSGVFLLHGVTGSGKTEVYMNVIRRVLDAGKTAIMLVPEIGLTPQVLANFRARFGNNVAILHSGLTDGERYDEWFRLHTGEAKIAIGARSAVFAPVENVGVIIIDEEHDGSYFSESNPRFHTHEIARVRCEYNNCPLVLGSATPSIETYHKATNHPVTPAACHPSIQEGNYKLLRLDRRVNNLEMPTVEVVDMAAEMRSGNGGVFSRVFIEKLSKVLEQGKQAIIFLNRRGFSSYVMCKNCGWVARCENCDVSLVYHKEDAQLKCHYCASRFTSVSRCPECSGTYLKHGATGTQKLVEELEKLMQNASGSSGVKVFRMDADNIKTKDDLIDILDEFGKTPAAILVGTQMVAKGHHFPNVALVGIIDADNSLHFSDYRAVERTFALITQVAGRAGRAADASVLQKKYAKPFLEQNTSSSGHVVLQTYIPTHYVYRLAANYDYQKFFDKEINTRQVTKYPPFTSVVRVLVTGERDDQIKTVLQKIMTDLRTREKDFVYLGAMKSPLGRLQNKFRYQILIRVPRTSEKEMLDFIDGVVRSHQPKNLQIFLEINPQSLS